MAKLQRYYLPAAPGQLLGHILERPELVAAVRELPAATLSRLVDRVGLEDSGELIALASTEQLEAMFDEDLWRADPSGFEEKFDPQRFALWLQVMGEAGNDFLVQRLCELDLDLLTLAVHRLVLVIDMDDLLNHLAGARDEAGRIEMALANGVCEEWEEFRLIARDLDAWEDVWSALLSLDREHHERLRDILERCIAMSTEFINGQGGLYEVLTSDEMLEGDALAERNDRRAEQGFVSRGDARGFLQLAGEGGQALAERDSITAAYFRELGTAGRGTHAVPAARLRTGSAGGADLEGLSRLIAASDPDAPTWRTGGMRVLQGGAAQQQSTANAPRVANRKPAAQPRRRGQRDASAARARAGQPGRGVRSEPARKPSTAVMTRDEPANGALAAALAVLASQHPEAHSARMEDLAYLANVLIAGSTHEGRKLRPVEALEAAVATCNLGLELWERSGRASKLADARLLQQVGCDRLFRVAWPALQRELVQPARRALQQRCATLDADSAREARKFISEETVFSLRSVCRASDLELEGDAFDALLALAETLPWHAAQAHRWIDSRADLDRARRHLPNLARANVGQE